MKPDVEYVKEYLLDKEERLFSKTGLALAKCGFFLEKMSDTHSHSTFVE